MLPCHRQLRRGQADRGGVGIDVVPQPLDRVGISGKRIDGVVVANAEPGDRTLGALPPRSAHWSSAPDGTTVDLDGRAY